MNDFWDEAEVISMYTDAQALEDGVLVDLEPLMGATIIWHDRPVNRITANLLHDLLPFLIDREDIMGHPIDRPEQMTPGHRSDLCKTLRTKLKYAHDTADPGSERDVLYEAPPYLYVAVNETGGWTFMRKDDY